MKTITKGHRHVTLYDAGVTLAHSGVCAEEIERIMMAMNANQCTPPLSESNLRHVIKSVKSKIEETRQTSVV